MNNNLVELRVLIKGKPITEYSHNGQLFVEGRHGSNFEIELINHNHFSVEAIVSVDGLSVIDGKDAGPDSSGYMIKARETLRIPGWKLNAESVAAFEFAGKKASYAATGGTGSVRNTGVIGMLAYKEKHQSTYGGPFLGGVYLSAAPVSGGTSISRGFTSGSASFMAPNSSHTVWNSSDLLSGSGLDQSFGMPNATSLSCMAISSEASARAACDTTLSSQINALCAQVQANQCTATTTTDVAKAALSQPVVQQTLGTAFGKQQDFATETVTFTRGDLLAMSVIYYDDGRGLKARGIELERRKPKYDTSTPDAFPGMSCKPPVGWKG